MKNIAFVSNLSGIGGTEVSLIKMLNSMPLNKYNVTLFLIGDKGPLFDRIPAWVKVVNLENKAFKADFISNLKNFNLFSAFKRLFWELICFIDYKIYKKNTMHHYAISIKRYKKIKEKFDACILWCWPNSVHTLYALNNIKAKKRIMWVHMDVSMDVQPSDSERFFNKFDKIYCVSNACKKVFDDKYKSCDNKTEVYYNILDTEEIINHGKEKIKTINNSDFNIISCGRLSVEKQPFMAIDVVNNLIADGIKNFKWYFVGDGNIAADFIEKIKSENLEEYIIPLGAKKNPYKYVSKADLYVQMSKHESFCLTLAEAQVLGIPAVTTNFASAYEIVDDNNTGYIVENNWYNIYEKIKMLIQNKNELERINNNLKSYSLKANGSAQKLCDYIDSI